MQLYMVKKTIFGAIQKLNQDLLDHQIYGTIQKLNQDLLDHQSPNILAMSSEVSTNNSSKLRLERRQRHGHRNGQQQQSSASSSSNQQEGNEADWIENEIVPWTQSTSMKNSSVKIFNLRIVLSEIRVANLG